MGSISRLPVSRSLKNRPPLTLEQLEARMLMAFDALGSQLDQLAQSEGLTQLAPSVPSVESTLSNTLRSLALVAPDGTSIVGGRTLTVGTTSLQLQIRPLNSANQILSSLPKTTVSVTSTDRLARGTVSLSGTRLTLSFNRAADYNVVTTSGSVTHRFTIRYNPNAVVSLAVINATNNQRIADNGLVSITTVGQGFKVQGLTARGSTVALSGQTTWTVVSSPAGGTATFQTSNGVTTATFNRAGGYTLRVTNGSMTSRVRVQVTSTLTSILVTSPSNSVNAGSKLQFSAIGRDQFQQAMAQQPTFTWTAGGGSVTASGLYTAGATAGNFSVTARSGTISNSRAVSVVATSPVNPVISGINDAALRSLITTFYADNTISRDEMIQILRSTGNDGTVSSTELADLRTMASANSTINMPTHVRGLLRNVVNTNSANLKYQGQTAGNLQAGSNATLLNKLVDKWFLGTDLPTLTNNNYSYQHAVGSLYVSAPSLANSRQGMLGDCYFLAALTSIAQRDENAIRNMFIDNGDGTFTVRFYAGSLGAFYQGSLISAGFISGSGTADWVTVNRSLPTNSSGQLVYSGYGLSAASTSTALWLALAEKAYAQWNETGRAGRNGTNTYAGIEGGWMHNVNAQVLGYNSTYYEVNSSTKQAMVNALNAGRAVTMGTNPNASTGNLVGSHAYVVTAYNASTDTFSMYNPWSSHHPTPLTWTQMIGQVSAFVVVDPTGSVSSASQGNLKSSNQLAAAASTTAQPTTQAAQRTQWSQQIDSLLSTEVELAFIAADSPLASAAHETPSAASDIWTDTDLPSAKLADVLSEMALLSTQAHSALCQC
ncbi:MAG: hypothetical protein KF752_18865 [Pirellulaceae bacterium]|nr:hypothetical protein [Pirellulaceae bacterium]